MMLISERYFDGTQSLAIKVVPEQYDSDPDLFISMTNTQPTSSLDSQWYCTKQGSDTCIISKDTIKQGDTLYIGVRCINPCQYTLASNYISEIPMKDNNRTQIRLDGYSSTIFSYQIPSVNTNGITRAVTITMHSEDDYTPIDLYLSMDNTIYQIEERKIENLLKQGVGYMFTENDFGWCTNCYIYVLADVYTDGRYYVTFTSHSRSNTITQEKSDLIINARQQECVLYFALAADNDVMLYSTQYQGDTDFYISSSTRPNDYLDTTRILQQGIRLPHKCLIITSEDRTRWGFRTGVINVCAYGFTTSTVQIDADEDNYGGRYDARDGVSYMLNLEKNSSQYFRYTNSKFIYAGNMTVSLTAYNLSSGQQPPRLFYKICPSSDGVACSLNSTEQRGQGMIEIASGNGNVTNGNTRIANIVHNRTLCPRPSSCYYLINMFFPDQNGPMKTSFMLTYNSTAFQNITIDQKFQNILIQGQYFYYALQPNSSDGFGFLQSLTIKLESKIGDADLIVSVVDQNPEIDQNQFEARGTDTYDSISLNNTGNFSLNRPIYIAVYAATFCVYEISFEPVYKVEYNAKLVKAVPMTDSIAYSNLYKTEFEESFYSFRPWWAGYEQRTIVFFAEVVFNNVFFYLEANDYPQFYLTEYNDKNDTIVLYPGDDQYSLYNTYFIRVRPDFQMQDLISSRDYIFNFFVFSQLPTREIVDIHLNEKTFGYANQSSVFFKHFIIENNATYNFSVIPIIGDPAILLKLSNNPIYPVSADVQSWDYKTDNEGKVTDSIIVTFTDRSSKYAFCDNAGFNLNGGNKSCGFYLAVECKSECIFNITVQIQGRENQTLPKYLIENNYYTGQVSNGQYSYFYFPLSKNATGELVIILNKTGSIGQNGDSMILVNLMSESVTKSLTNWSYPVFSSYNIGSANFRPTQPEIIEICSSIISSRCSDNSCLLMIGVLGLTQNRQSKFRLMIQKQDNKLYDTKPIQDFIANAGDYKYYWFTSNVSVSNPNTAWEYQITTSATLDGGDVDLYISSLDGRFPVTEDYDFASENLGADSIYVNSNSSFFDEAGYNKSNGIIFVVGVKAITPNVSFTLIMTGPSRTAITITNLTAGQQITRGLQGNAINNRTNYFKWYNWGQKDFRINIDVTQGNVSAYINFVGEEVFNNNGLLALPVNNNNSKWVVYLNASQSGVLQVSKSDIGANKLFCYYCWYFITITTNLTGTTSYRISVNEVPDVGEEVALLQQNTSVSLTLPATGTASTRKFILDSKDPFVIQASLSTGYLIMYVGLYPESPRTRYQFYAEGSKDVKISVRQTDQNFKVGAFYYITCQSGQGRTTFTLSLNQRKTVNQLENGIIYKDQYWNMDERIKLYYFQTPASRVNLFRAVINIQALTPGFYPILLLNRVSQTSIPSDFTKLTYPNMKTFNISFGDNFFSIANQRNFTYQIRDIGGNNTYYTIALYSFSYGMTDKRKPQFKISLTIDNKTLQSEHYSGKYYQMNLHEGEDLQLPGYYSSGIYDDYEQSENFEGFSWDDSWIDDIDSSVSTSVKEIEFQNSFQDSQKGAAAQTDSNHKSSLSEVISDSIKKVGSQIEEYFNKNLKASSSFINLQE